MPDDLTEYLRPEVLAKVGNLELVAKFIVEGYMIGLHRSPYHGFSVEFSSYRKYAPGDELKFVDWRVYGRTDKFYVKQFEETTNLNCYIAMDMSGSMRFAGDGNEVSKFLYGSFLAAGLSYMMLQQGDAIALAAFNSETFDYLPPSGKSNRLMNVLAKISRLRPDYETGLLAGLNRLAERVKGRSLIVLISDLLVEPGELAEALSFFRYQNHEVVVFQILADHELDFPYYKQTSFKDIETGQEIITESGYIRDEYMSLLQKHIEEMKDKCTDVNVDFVPLRTSEELGQALTVYLSKRATYT